MGFIGTRAKLMYRRLCHAMQDRKRNSPAQFKKIDEIRNTRIMKYTNNEIHELRNRESRPTQIKK